MIILKLDWCRRVSAWAWTAIARLVNMPAEDVYSLMCDHPSPQGPPQAAAVHQLCNRMRQQLHTGESCTRSESCLSCSRTGRHVRYVQLLANHVYVAHIRMACQTAHDWAAER